MKIRRAFVVCLMMLAFEIAVGQEEPVPVGLRNLTSAPQQFDGKLVRLRGFSAIDVQPRHAPVFMLYPGQSEAKDHITQNAVLVVPDQAMIRSKERLKHWHL
ncbi:MAG TPA: hypothetical protein VN517_12220 [Terriglobales bacterium]|nr:hypothetical protein [Terriglobales bacterium]